MGFSSVRDLIEDFKLGRMIILVDDENRENEGDLVLAAEFVTPEKINFMAKSARGLICLALAPALVDQLQLPLMVPESVDSSPDKTAFTISIDARHGIATGISAADRAHTIQVAIDPKANRNDLSCPGHIFPLRAKAGGVHERPGHTEAGVDLAKLAGLRPASVLCEVVNDDGTMARLSDLRLFAQQYHLKIGKIQDLIVYLQEVKSNHDRKL